MSDVVLNKINSAVATGQHMNESNAQKAKVQHIDRNIEIAARKRNEVKSLSPTELKNTINKINENVGMLNKDVKFVYNDTIKSLVVKVVNAKTGKVIREIPPKEVINLQKKLSEVVGIIFDSKEVK